MGPIKIYFNHMPDTYVNAAWKHYNVNDINLQLQGPLLLTWFNFNPNMDK